MEPDPWLWGALSLAGVLVGFMNVLSRLETAVINTRRSRLLAIENDPRVSKAEAIIEAPEQFQTSAHLAKSLCESILYAAAALVGIQASLMARGERLPDSIQEMLALVWPGILGGAVITYLIVTVIGEALPKSWATRDPERILVRATGFISVFSLLFGPVRWGTSLLARLLARSTGADPVLTARAAHSEEEIKLLVEGSAEEGVLEEEERQLIHSIFEFTETVARQIMVPRIDVRSVSVETPLNDVVRAAMSTGHSRLPVYEGTLDKVVGVIHVKDLLPYLVEGLNGISIRELMRSPFFVPEAKKIDELLQEFRAHKSQLAVVVDEFGGTSGIVTVEDVLEEIVGEIEDEYDRESHPAAVSTAHEEGALVDGRMTIDDVNDELGLTLPTENYDTLGGLVFSLFGHPPEVGEQVAYDGVEFVAETVEGLRISKVRIIVRQPEPEPEHAPT
jgi:putative hemolysin